MAKNEVQSSTVDQSLSLGSQAWNVADGYTKIKILRHLVQLDRYENIALYGTEDMEDFSLEPDVISTRRQEALYRFMSTLRQLLGNVSFAIRKDDQAVITDYIAQIDFISSVIAASFFEETNMISHETVLRINEPHFRKCVTALRRIKDEVNFPINKAGLIFRSSDEIDLDKITKEIIEGG